MSKRFELTTLVVFNPSPYPRYGYVTVPWAPIQAEARANPAEITLQDGSFQPLEYQVDCTVPGVSSQDVLVFRAHQPERSIAPGPDDYSRPSAVVSLRRGKPELERHTRAWVELKSKDGKPYVAGLCNGRISAWINLTPGDESRGEYWYAGCATSVRVPYTGRPDGLESLDAFRSVNNGWMCHDREKRCMQVDQLHLVDVRGTPISPKVDLFNRAYELVAHGGGPLRAFVTIALPFETSVGGQLRRYRLYRVISVYIGLDHLIEEVFLRSDTGSNPGTPQAVEQPFRVGYFSHMDMGKDEENVLRCPNVADWFALGSKSWAPYPGYGFATDAHTEDFRRDESDRPDAYKRFWWQTQPSSKMTCLHLFMRGRQGTKRGEYDHFDARTGRAWYEFIFKKLWAEVA